MTSAYDRNKEPATDEHTRREGSLREEAGEKGERRTEPGSTGQPFVLTGALFPVIAGATRKVQSPLLPLVEEKPGVCSTGKGEEIVCSNGEPVFIDSVTGQPVALNVLLKSL